MSENLEDDVAAIYVDAATECLQSGLEKIKHCLGQLDDGQLWWRPHESMNSIGNLLLHLAGNLRQWLDAGVGGTKDTRDRPAEFAQRQPIPRDEILLPLEQTIADAVATMSKLGAKQLVQQRRIQGFDTSVLAAIFDSVAHFRGHVQEIIHMTRCLLGDRYRFHWRPASVEQGAAE